MAETDAPAERRVIAGQIEAKADAERADKAAGISAHAVHAHRGAAPRRVGGLHGSGGERGTVPEYRGEPDRYQCTGDDHRMADEPAGAERENSSGEHRRRYHVDAAETLRAFVAGYRDRNADQTGQRE